MLEGCTFIKTTQLNLYSHIFILSYNICVPGIIHIRSSFSSGLIGTLPVNKGFKGRWVHDIGDKNSSIWQQNSDTFSPQDKSSDVKKERHLIDHLHLKKV